jgi:aspartyl-tRNA(Asn)/glutamyl-tRNA(Gln) amidotransferase subunit B
VGDVDELGAQITDAIAANPKAAADFRAGREAALQALVGQVMKATRGRADARLVTTLLRERLSG